MKRLLTLAAVFALILSSAAFGEVHDFFGKFTLDVPEGWTATITRDDSAGVVTRDDNMAQVTVMIADAEGKSLREIAEYEAKAYRDYGFTDVTEPVRNPNSSYSFSAVNPHGATTSVNMTIFGENLIDITVVIAPGHDDAINEIDKILGSLSIK